MLSKSIIATSNTLRNLATSVDIAQLILDVFDVPVAVQLMDDEIYRSTHPEAETFMILISQLETLPEIHQTITVDEMEVLVIPLHRDSYTQLGIIVVQAEQDEAELVLLLADLVAARLSELQAAQDIRTLANERSIITSLNILVHSTFDISQLGQNLYDIIQQIYLPDTLHLSVQSLDARTVQRVAVSGDATKQTEMPFGYDIHDQVIRQARPILWRNQQERDSVCAALDVDPTDLPASFIGLPLESKDRIIGTLSCSNEEPEILHESYVQILLTVADSTTLAVENILLLDDTMRRVREMALLNDISQHLSSSFNDEDLWFLLRETLHDLFEDSSITIGLRDTSTGKMAFLLNGNTDWQEQQPDELSQIVLENNIPLHFRDISKEETRLREFNVHGSFINQTNIRSWIGAPLRDANNEIIGVLATAHVKPAFFTDDSLSMLNNLAAQLSLALSNARLLNSQKSRTEGLVAMQRLSSLINSVLDLGAIVTLSAEAMVGLFKVDFVTVVAMSLEQSKQPLIVQQPDSVQRSLLEEAFREYHNTRSFNSGYLARRTPLTITPQNIDQIAQPDSAIYRYFTESNCDVYVVMPMIVKEESIGWIGLGINDAQDAAQFDHDMLVTIARELALSIHNADLYQQAVEGNRLKSEFLASVSHELRTPLNAIIGYTDLLLRGTYGTVPEKQIDRLERIRRSGHNLLQLIDDILDLAKLEAGKLVVSRESINIAELTSSVVEDVRPLIDIKELDLQVTIVDDLPRLDADPVRIHQILRNILSNAAKFTSEGFIHVHLHTIQVQPDIQIDNLPVPAHLQIPSGEWLVIQVEDSGVGIAAENLQTIFEAFRQVDGSQSREYEGTGLGLAITQRLVVMHNGFIWAHSELDVGSKFYVLLPVRQ